MSATRLEPGDQAPAFTLPDQDGEPVSLSDFRGRKLLLYFYPADDTPGCTKEACGFNDNLARFQALDTPVIGVSPDPAARHRSFRNRYGLAFPLLTDADHEVMRAYGAWGQKVISGSKREGVIRSTFLIDEAGAVKRAWYTVKADGHAEEVLTTLTA
jgi:peroxiredoxin Q/BCP